MATTRFGLENSIVLLVLALSILTASLVSASKVRFIDDENIETIAKIVCSTRIGSQVQIGRASTISNLVSFYNNLAPNQHLGTCHESDIHALHLLNEVLTKRNDNVCSDEKISLIEKFHYAYISRTRKYRKDEFSKSAPKLVKLFFYHYATLVGTTCKNSLIKQIDDVSGNQEKADEEKIERVDGFLTAFAKQIGSISGSFKSYDEISLLWNFVDKLPMNEADKYINESGKRCAIKVNDAAAIHEFQRDCSTRLKPIYGQLALPVIRLIDLGYYLNNEPFEGELSARKDLRRLVGVAQVCEFVLPLRIIEDNSLKANETVLLTKEQASEIPYEDGEFDVAIIPDNPNSSLHLDSLDSEQLENAERFVKTIRSNIKSRERIMRNILSSMVQSTKKKIKSLVGKIFFSQKLNNKYVKTEATPSFLLENDRRKRNLYDDRNTLDVPLSTQIRDRITSDVKIMGKSFLVAGPFGVVFVFGILATWLFNILKYTFIGLGLLILYPLIKMEVNRLNRESD